jgi:hypothetical protein
MALYRAMSYYIYYVLFPMTYPSVNSRHSSGSGPRILLWAAETAFQSLTSEGRAPGPLRARQCGPAAGP